MTGAEAASMIRFRTGRDNSGHVQDVSLWPELDLEVKNLRRMLQDRVPQPFTKSSTPTPSSAVIAFPADYDKPVRLERLVSGSGLTARYEEVTPADNARPQSWNVLGWREESTGILLTPPEEVASVLGWRLTYVFNTTVTINDSGDLLDVPAGFEQVVVLRVCRTVAIRCHDEEKAVMFHDEVEGNQAKGIKGRLPELMESFRKRYGRVARPGFTPGIAGTTRRGGLP